MSRLSTRSRRWPGQQCLWGGDDRPAIARWSAKPMIWQHASLRSAQVGRCRRKFTLERAAHHESFTRVRKDSLRCELIGQANGGARTTCAHAPRSRRTMRGKTTPRLRRQHLSAPERVTRAPSHLCPLCNWTRPKCGGAPGTGSAGGLRSSKEQAAICHADPLYFAAGRPGTLDRVGIRGPKAPARSHQPRDR